METRNTIYVLHTPHPDTEKMKALVEGYGLAPKSSSKAVANAMLETSKAWMILDLIRLYGDARSNITYWHRITGDDRSPAVVKCRHRATELLEEIGRALGAKSLPDAPAQGENHG